MKSYKSESVKVFILMTKLSKAKESLAYLEKYNYEIIKFENISSLICSMYQENPVCIFVSAESTVEDSAGISVLSSQGDIPVVGFIENNLISSMARLNVMSVKYKLRPPISGAAAYRILQKIILDQKPLAV